MRTLKEWMMYIVDWRRRKGFQTNWLNIVEKMWLVEEELHEAGIAHRHMHPDFLKLMQNKNNGTIELNEEDAKIISDHKDLYDNFREEIADTMIRILDLAGSLDIDLDSEIAKKMETNEGRPEKHGKSY